MSFILNFRKRKLTLVNCRTCGGSPCNVGTPPGVFTLDYQCGDCVRQQRVPAYIPNDDHSMYFVTVDPNGDHIKQKLGSDSDPFSLEMYRRLDTAHTATSEEIRDAYNRRRHALNPPEDPNRCRENAAETARVEQAYQILLEPSTRRKYNKFGLTTDCIIIEEGGFDQISGALVHMLGDGNLYDIIGAPILLPKILAERARLELYNDNNPLPREVENEILGYFLADGALLHVAGVLNQKLNRYNPNNEEDFRNEISAEAEHLRRHRNGPKILHAVGSVYSTIGRLFAKIYSNSNGLFVLLVLCHVYWQIIFRHFQFKFDTAQIKADYNNAVAEERDYLAKRWPTVSRRQQLKERCLQLMYKKYWASCQKEFEMRLWVACEIIFQEELRIGDGMREMLERKANGLRIMGEIYQNQL